MDLQGRSLQMIAQGSPFLNEYIIEGLINLHRSEGESGSQFITRFVYGELDSMSFIPELPAIGMNQVFSIREQPELNGSTDFL